MNVPAAAVLAPMITLSMLSLPPPLPSMLISPLAVKFVNTAVDAELAPIAVPSMAPPLMSAVSVARVIPLAMVMFLLTVISSELSVVAKFM